MRLTVSMTHISDNIFYDDQCLCLQDPSRSSSAAAYLNWEDSGTSEPTFSGAVRVLHVPRMILLPAVMSACVKHSSSTIWEMAHWLVLVSFW